MRIEKGILMFPDDDIVLFFPIVLKSSKMY